MVIETLNPKGKDPNNVNMIGSRGFLLAKLGKYEKAITWYDKALAIDPNNVNVLVNKGLALINKALRIDPNNVYALVGKGHVLHTQGKYQEAIEYFDKAFKIDPNNVYAIVKAMFFVDRAKTMKQ